ncbi:MAG: N-acetylmuramoyl-L-alanine amidase [Gammaproteobacteria bacterium]|nr:N-acetylmuramoyl-L-alanine amidase [Gammaproteobacteria bacterium]
MKPIRHYQLVLALGCATALCAFPKGGATAAEVEGVRVWRSPERTRIVFDLDGTVVHHLIRLDEIGQLLIDLEDSSLAPAFPEAPGPNFGDGPVTGLRVVEAPRGNLRFAVELAAPVAPSGFVLPPIAQYGDRLVIDLYDIVVEPPAAAEDMAPTPAPEAIAPAPLPGETPPAPPRDVIVAISAGHGGEDPGAVVGRDYEKDINLAVSRFLFERLADSEGFQPLMIREGDYAVALRRRPDIAREHRADLFVSIHADAYRASTASGMTIYALSGDRADRENAARVARKENTVDLIAGVDADLRLGDFDDDLALALVSVHMGWSMEQSRIAGEHILRAAGEVTKLRRDRVQQASLAVLISPDIPSILVETGYMTNPAELAKLTTPGFQRRLADALAVGILSYFDERAPEGTLVAWRKANPGQNADQYLGPANEVDRLAAELMESAPR